MSTAVASSSSTSTTNSGGSAMTMQNLRQDNCGNRENDEPWIKIQSHVKGNTVSRNEPSSEQTQSKMEMGDPLPADLRTILTEVAQTGSCSTLLWNPEPVERQSFGGSLASSTSQHRAGSVGMQVRSRQPFVSTGKASLNQRNGVHKRPRNFTNSNAGRKRPLLMIRTSATAGVFSPGSVESSKTSGSEPEDTSQYEWDSEGTSATTNSEFSIEKRRERLLAQRTQCPSSKPSFTSISLTDAGQGSKSLRQVFRTALEIVLEYWYKNRGGYRLSSIEKRKKQASLARAADSDNALRRTDGSDLARNSSESQNESLVSEEEIFNQRKTRILNILGSLSGNALDDGPKQHGDDGPPFTIQRIAEVLLAPEKYYTQTHKLCNCLEKLLLVKSSADAFGGSNGGDTAQSRREQLELAALADEKGRLESERLRRMRRMITSPVNDVDQFLVAGQDRVLSANHRDKKHKTHDINSENMKDYAGSKEQAEAAARASLRSKFDHVGIDPHSPDSPVRDIRAISESRGMTNSPPPPGLSCTPVPALPLSGQGSILRHHGDHDHSSSLRRPHSPVLFSSLDSSAMAGFQGNQSNVHLLQMHHAAALAGLSPLELVGLTSNENSSPSLVVAAAGRDVDLESRSSASSDVDSESDVSFDDSASDRSDGSDSGHHEQLSAARTIGIGRIQQQRLHNLKLGTQHNTDYRPSGEEVGEAMESIRSEDSGGSDSSSSELND